MSLKRIATPGAIVLALGALLTVAGCKSSSQWQFSREGQSGKITTMVLVRTEPTDAEISVSGKYLGRSPVEIPIRYVGFRLPNKFVVGYGLDHNERYRNLRYLAELDETQTTD